MTTRADTIATVLRRPVLHRRLLAHELRERLVQGLGPGSTDAEWTATVPQLAEALDTALTKWDAATAGALAGSEAAGHALVVSYEGSDLVGRCQCGPVLGRVRPGTALDSLAVPWVRHTSLDLAAAAIRASA
ncbi:MULTISPECIES: hypothetical protein [unclassified Streptomyces]|uniref:hypothetical protein n=1 Tax=unclassified Streptomyces TaxID=2593676 RepID=UPI0014886083|nr:MULTISPECIES: hypothetical protein [unclassified Streptomyces]